MELEVDLDRHAVIEASAGTGKTHALVELVLRLLLEKQTPLEQILLVTYTEKATGELKERLRKGLEDQWQKQPARRDVLLAALDSFDRANVHTIHGFCQRVLQEHALEYGSEFRAQLVSDPELLIVCLRELQRERWLTDYRDSLATVLEIADYQQRWETLVIEVSKGYRPACNHLLRPEAIADLVTMLDERTKGLRVGMIGLRNAAGMECANGVKETPWWVGFSQLDYRRDYRDARQTKLLLPLLQWLDDSTALQRPLTSFLQLTRQCTAALDTFTKNGFSLLTTCLSQQAQAQLADLCPGLSQAVVTLEQWRLGTDWDTLKHQLAVTTVQQLLEALAAYKRERGQQSFEDMLTRVDEAIDSVRNPKQAAAILAALQSRFRYAVVDEFQDTDPIQWHIFQRIFVTEQGPQRLFVVGDPKQAIFGFRGADLYEYQEAGKVLRTKHAAKKYTLKVNWRSSPELLNALNRLFGNGSWFDDANTRYQAVKAPSEDDSRFKVIRDATGRPALSLVDFSNAENLTQARQQMATFIAREVGALLAGTDGTARLVYQDKGGVHDLKARDICVLVARRGEARPVMDALRDKSMPYTFAKQTGLWKSAEAVHLGYVLRALARPGDMGAFHKALLTQFFRVRPEELSQCEELPADHAASRLFLQWCALARERHWAELFQSLLEDTGFLFHDLEAADADRRVANCRHVFQTLAQAAYTRDLDLLGVLEVLEQKRRSEEEDDSGLQPVETDQPKVRIMTMHAAKGLEFPVVFLAGGFTAGKTSEFLTYREDGKLVFDLDAANDEAKNKQQREQDAEQRRLYYVALTRAMFKLYVPYIPARKGMRQPGPLVTLVAPAVAQSGTGQVGAPVADLISPLASRRPAVPSPPATRQSPPEHGEGPPLTLSTPLFPRLDKDLPRRRIRVRSFSSLHRRSERRAPEEPTYADWLVRDRAETGESAEEDSLRGPVFGDMVHDVLEEIDFEHVGRARNPGELPNPARALIEEVRQCHWPKLPARLTGNPGKVEECRQELARLVWNGLQTPLDEAGGPLWRVPPRDRLHELEFHFPEYNGRARPRGEEGFLTGFMDLVFCREGRFFLVDWKTNYLHDGYAKDQVAQSMRDCDYVRQFRLYVQALKRWLERWLGAGFDFKRHFGGVYYLYLRGMNGRDESTGVFFYRPGDSDLDLGGVLGNDRP
jgi:exodeoxyribonuclease V beta subunit